MSEYPSHCPPFEYERHEKRKEILPVRVEEVLRDLARGDLDPRSVALDTRVAHRYCFRELTPKGYEYYAGHYRGERYPCLLQCMVAIQGDPSVGLPPQSVQFYMRQLNAALGSGFIALDSAGLTHKDRLRYLVVIVARAFELFLRIHPFANGNGHAGRFLVWSAFGQYGHWPRRWPVEPRPPEPGYTQAITAYRNGDPNSLELYLLATLGP